MLGAMEPGAQVWKLLLSADAREEEVAQRGGECHVLGTIRGQAGRGSEHLIELWVSLFSAGGLDQMTFKGSPN